MVKVCSYQINERKSKSADSFCKCKGLITDTNKELPVNYTIVQ